MKFSWPFWEKRASNVNPLAFLQPLNVSEDRYLGCLLGGAIGDALGSPVEFMSLRAILAQHGDDGIRTFVARGDTPAASITDDTQMSLFMAEAVLSAWARRTSVREETALGCLHWLQTQSEDLNPSAQLLVDQRNSRIAREPGIHHRRAPGETCTQSLSAMKSTADLAINNSKGCGSVMRMAPLGLHAASLNLAPVVTFALAMDCAAVTHGHRTGQLTAGVFALLMQRLVAGIHLRVALSEAKMVLKMHEGHHECIYAIEKAERLAEMRHISHREAVHRIGDGWVAEQALAVGIYCAWIAQDFREGVLIAVNHDGDSDSLGSVAGNLLGAIHGKEGIPSEWIKEVEMGQLICNVARDLFAIQESPSEELRERFRKYWLSDLPAS